MSGKVDDLKDQRVPPCLYWSVEEVANWMVELGFPQYKDCIVSNLINGKRLIIVDASALPKIGITDFEHIKIISQKLRELLGIEDPYWNRSISQPPREDLGLYLERKSQTGETSTGLSYGKFLLNSEEMKWQPPLSNHCLIMPQY